MAATACLASPLPPFTLFMASAATDMDLASASPVSLPWAASCFWRSITASISALVFALL
ncbi:hypothetical protein D3C85_935890 [compost metagenome]